MFASTLPTNLLFRSHVSLTAFRGSWLFIYLFSPYEELPLGIYRRDCCVKQDGQFVLTILVLQSPFSPLANLLNAIISSLSNTIIV